MSQTYSINIAFSADKTEQVYQIFLSILTNASRAQFNLQTPWTPCNEFKGALEDFPREAAFAYGFRHPENSTECLTDDFCIQMPLKEEFKQKLESDGFERPYLNELIRQQNDMNYLVFDHFDVSFSVGKKWGYLKFQSPFSDLSSFMNIHDEVKAFFVDCFSAYAEFIWFDFSWFSISLLFPQCLSLDYSSELGFSVDGLYGGESPDDVVDDILTKYHTEQIIENLCDSFDEISVSDFAECLNKELTLNTLSANRENKSLLDLAIEAGRMDIAYFLIEQGIHLNHVSEDEWPVIARTLKHGHLNLFKDLLKKGLSVELEDFHVYAIFWNAIEQPNLGILRFLFEETGYAGLLSALDKHVALRCAAVNGHLAIEKYLIGNGAGPHFREILNNEVVSLNTYQVHHLFWQAIYNNLLDILSYLFEETSINDYIIWGRNLALHEASAQGNLQMALYLLEKGFAPNFVDKYGKTPLDYALERYQNLTQSLNPEAIHEMQSQQELIHLLKDAER